MNQSSFQLLQRPTDYILRLYTTVDCVKFFKRWQWKSRIEELKKTSHLNWKNITSHLTSASISRFLLLLLLLAPVWALSLIKEGLQRQCILIVQTAICRRWWRGMELLSLLSAYIYLVHIHYDVSHWSSSTYLAQKTNLDRHTHTANVKSWSTPHILPFWEACKVCWNSAISVQTPVRLPRILTALGELAPATFLIVFEHSLIQALTRGSSKTNRLGILRYTLVTWSHLHFGLTCWSHRHHHHHSWFWPGSACFRSGSLT